MATTGAIGTHGQGWAFPLESWPFSKRQHCKLANVLILSLTVGSVSQNWLAPLQQSWQQLPPMTFQWGLLHVGTQTWCGDWHCNSMSWAIVLVTLYLGEGVRARRSYNGIVFSPPSVLQLSKTVPFMPLSLSSSCSETVYRTTQHLA